jgi:hypothetical protein
VFDDGAHVPGPKTVRREVLGEDDALIELEGHGSFSGISVTGLGVVSPDGAIKIDRTQASCRPLP